MDLLPAAIEYNPINELNARDNNYKQSYNRYQFGLNYKFNFPLQFDIKYQFEEGNYNKYTSNVIAPTISDPTNGFGEIVANTAEISNKGVDININTININMPFKWTTTLNFS
jgi:hypothetical protein